MNSGGGSGWLRVFHPAPGAPRVLILPHGGGSATYYHGLSRALSPAVEPVIVQYPGRAERLSEPAYEDLSALVDAVVQQLDGPAGSGMVGYFGHSMGASIAFEVARKRAPQQLFLSGRRPPRHHRQDNFADRGDAAILAEVKRLAGTSADVFDNPELLELVLPALRADYRALQGYVPAVTATVDAPITALLGDDDPRVDPTEVLDWARHTTATFSQHVFTGGHFYIDTHLPEIATIIRSQLAG